MTVGDGNVSQRSGVYHRIGGRLHLAAGLSFVACVRKGLLFDRHADNFNLTRLLGCHYSHRTTTFSPLCAKFIAQLFCSLQAS